MVGLEVANRITVLFSMLDMLFKTKEEASIDFNFLFSKSSKNLQPKTSVQIRVFMTIWWSMMEINISNEMSNDYNGDNDMDMMEIIVYYMNIMEIMTRNN